MKSKFVLRVIALLLTAVLTEGAAVRTFGQEDLVLVDNTDNSLTYQEQWSEAVFPGTINGSIALGNIGSSVSLKMNASYIKIIVKGGPGAGMIKIFLNGNDEGNFDTYTKDHEVNIVAYEKELQPGIHEIKIVGIEEKNPEAKGTNINFDAFYYRSAGPQPERSTKDSSAQVFGAQRIKIQINNNKIAVNGEERQIDPDNDDVMPIVIDERVLIPVRALAEAIGAEVKWIESERKAEIILDGKKAEFWENDNMVRVGEEEIFSEIPLQVINGRIMAPVRFITERIFRCYVDWNEETQTAGITYDPFHLLPSDAGELVMNPKTKSRINGNRQIVTPEEYTGVVTNPGMGVQSYRTIADTNNMPFTSVVYTRFTWKQLEPEEGIYDFSSIDNALSDAKSGNRELAFRIMTYSRADYENLEGFKNQWWFAPDWFRQRHSGVRYKASDLKSFDPVFRSNSSLYGEDDDIWFIDMESEDYNDLQHKLLEALGERYNGCPDIAFIDIGGYGNWSEWHSPIGMPHIDIAKKYIDKCVEAFPDTQLIISIQSAVEHENVPLTDGIDNPYVLKYALERGMGWRYDGMEYSPVFMIKELLEGIGMEDVWKTTPAYFEPGSGSTDTRSKIFEPHRIEEFEKVHITGFHIFNDRVSDENANALKKILSFAGYRLVVKSLNVSAGASGGGTISFGMNIENKGVNPPYRNYILAVRLSSENNSYTFELDEDVKKWLPGEIKVQTEIDIPNDFEPGIYILSIGLLDPYYKTPKVQFAIEGKSDSGWYPMCKIGIGK